MKDEDKTKEQLINELAALRQHALVEEEFRRARREWENIFQAIGHLTLILDPQRNIIAANHKAVRAIGWSEKELLGKKCYEVFHENKPPENCPLDKMLISGRLETIDLEIEALGGIFLVSCTPVFDDAGHLEKVIHIVTDITERKQAEEEIRRYNEELAALNAIATTVGQTLDLKKVLCAALEETMKVLSVEGGLIYLFDEASQVFAPVVHHGIPQDVLRNSR